jgi:hypothetical protein
LRFSLESLRKVKAYLWKHAAGIVLAFLAVSSSLFGIGRWEASQAFSGLTLYCTQGQVLAPSTFAPTFNVLVGLKNPSLFQLDINWVVSINLNVNGSSYSSFRGILSDVLPARTSRIFTILFSGFLPSRGNVTLSRVVSYERYSIFGDVFTDPRIFYISTDITTQANASLVVSTLVFDIVPYVMFEIFSSHSNWLGNNNDICYVRDISG